MPNIRHSYPGKQFGSKAFRPTEESEEEESSEEEEEEEQQQQQQPIQQVAYRGSGKQFGGGSGKYLRRPNQDDDSDEAESDDEDEDEPPAPKPPPPTQRIQPRGGGKNFMRMQAPAPEESEEESDEDEPPQPPPAPAPVRVMGRGGGKSLARMQPPSEEEESSSSEEEEEPVKQAPPPAQRVQQVRRGGGKQLSSMRGPPPAAAPPPQQQQPPPAAEPDVATQPPPAPVPTPAPPATTTPATTTVRSPGGGKQLSRPAPKQPAPKPAATGVKVVRSPGGGKTLRRPKDDEEDEDDDDDESEEAFEDDDNDDDSDEDSDEDFVEEKPKKKAASARPKRKAATKKKIVVESDEDDDEKYFDNEESSDDEDGKALDPNNTEALIKDEEDRKHLDSLTEIEREAILADRFEKAKEKQDMQKAMREAKRKENAKASPEKKRKAPAPSAKQKKLKTANDAKLAKSLAGRRSSSRTRDVSGAKSKKAAALAALKRERKIQQDYEEKSSDESDMEFDDDDDSDEEYEESKPWQQTAKQTGTTPAKDDGSDMDIDDDADESGGGPSKQQRSSGPTVAIAELDDFMKVTIPRRRLKRWCNEPYFSAAVLECFVRLYIGDDDNGVKAYRLCEIVDVKEKQNSYKFPVEEHNKDAKVVSTNKVLRLRFGKSEKDFPMSFLSDNPILEGEVKKYVEAQRDIRGQLLTKRQATKLHRLQNNLISTYKYTTEDIERNLEERKKRGQAVGNLGSNQTRIALAVKAAQNRVSEAEDKLAESKRSLVEYMGPKRGEEELETAVKENKKEVDQATKELKKLQEDEQNLMAVIDGRKQKLKGMTKERKWAKVNHKALKMNQQADLLGYKAQQEADARKAAGVKEKFNPYARRKVKPKILWEVGQDDKEEEPDTAAATAEVETNNENSTEAAAPLVITQDPVAALAESHQFQIDEEGLASVSLAELGLGPNKKPKPNRVRKGLSIDEYFQRKENGTL